MTDEDTLADRPGPDAAPSEPGEDDEFDGRSKATGAPLVTPGEPRRPRSWKRLGLEWTTIAVAAVLLALGIRAFAFQAFFVPSPSMVPTLQDGDRILVQKAFISAKDIRTGDIVVFSRPPADTFCGANESDLVKRVIGLPGQTLWSKGNLIYVNGHVLNQPWIAPGVALGPPVKKTTLGADDYFMMGDNRGDSCDSRYWGPIKGTSVVGRVVLLWWRHGRPDFHLF